MFREIAAPRFAQPDCEPTKKIPKVYFGTHGPTVPWIPQNCLPRILGRDRNVSGLPRKWGRRLERRRFAHRLRVAIKLPWRAALKWAGPALRSQGRARKAPRTQAQDKLNLNIKEPSFGSNFHTPKHHCAFLARLRCVSGTCLSIRNDGLAPLRKQL